MRMTEVDRLELRLRKVDSEIDTCKHYTQRMKLYEESRKLQNEINNILGGIK